MTSRVFLCLVGKPQYSSVSSLVTLRNCSRFQLLRALITSAALWLVLAGGLRPAAAQAPIAIFPPGAESRLLSGFVTPEGLFVDSSGNLYVADNQFGGTSYLYKETKSGSSYNQSVIATGFQDIWAVVMDSSGNLYVADAGFDQPPYGAVYKLTNSGGTYSRTSIGSGWVSPEAVALDSSGNLYVADFGCPPGNCSPAKSGGLFKVTPSGTKTQIATTGQYFTGVAVDGSGNVYGTAWLTPYTSGALYKETVSTGGTSYTESAIASNFITPEGLAIDPAGNIYVPDDVAQGGAGIVYKETLAGGNYTQSKIITDLYAPEFVALDAAGNLYVTDYTLQGSSTYLGYVYKVDYADPPNLNFGSVNVGSTSSSQSITVANIGNASLEFEIPSSGDNPNIATGFTLASGGSGDCPLVTSSSSAAGTLAAGASCNLSVTFAPETPGSYSGSTLEITDNNLDQTSPYATQTITLSGTATGTAKASYLTVTGPSSVTAGTSATITVKADDASGNLVASYSGTVHFSSSDPSAVLPANATLTSGVGTFNVTLKTSGSQTVTATDTTTATVTGSTGITVNPAAASRLAITAPSTATAGTPFIFSEFAYDAYGNLASGDADTFHFTTTDGSATLPANSILSNGEGNFTGTLRSGGTQTITATDIGNSLITGTSNTITVDQAPSITSANNTTLSVGIVGSFSVKASGYPAPSFSETGALPGGVTFDAGGTLSGTPAAGTGGSYPITITASNAVGTNATQNFILTVDQPPMITSANGVTFTAGAAGSFLVTSTGYPVPVFSESGALPNGVTFGATGTLSGIPGAGTAGSYPLTITASNGVGGAGAMQSFTLKVNPPAYLVVTSTYDDAGTASNCTVQALSTMGTDSACSLRDALLEAASLGAADIYFDATKFAGATTIALGYAGTLNIPSNTMIHGLITGSGATLKNLVTVSGGGSSSDFSVFTVNSGVLGAGISNLTIANGYVQSGSGGGIYNKGVLTVNGSTLSGNHAAVNGGGASNEGTLTVIGSTFSGDSAANAGGGIFSIGALTVTGSTFSGNSAVSDGGGILSNGVAGATLTMTGTTVTGNSAGLYGGVATFIGTATLANSIVSGNSAPDGADTDGTYSDKGGNIVGGSALLSALGNYGGPTQTAIPLPGSPAICGGLASNIPIGVTTDQRGYPNTNHSYPSAAPPCVDAGSVQTNYAIAFTQQPSDVVQNAGMSPAPTVTLTENNVPFSGGSVTIPLKLSGSGTLSGGSASIRAGVATYSNLSVNAVSTGDELSATLALNSNLSLSVNSSQFNVTAPVTATQAIVSKVLTQGQPSASFTPVTGSGGTAPLKYRISPSLPAGVAIDSSSGLITGSPSATSTAMSYTVTVTDATNATASTGFMLTVNGPVVATTVIASQGVTVITPISSIKPVSGSGGTAPLKYTVSPTLPAGLVMSTSTGAISGLPIAPSGFGGYTVTVTDANGATATATFQFAVNDPVNATLQVSLADLTVNQPATPFTPVVGTGGTTPLTYSISPSLPAGLGMASSNGLISGTPSVSSSSASYTVTVTDANGATASNSFSLAVQPLTQTITSFAALTTPMTYGVGPITLAGQASSGLPVTFRLVSGPATVSGDQLNITGAGTVVVGADQAGNAVYAPAAEVTQTITVNPAGYVVNSTADDATGNEANCAPNPGGTGAGNCTLRDALAAAGSHGGGPITFDSMVFAEAQTITLSNGALIMPSNTTVQGTTSGTGLSLTNLITVDGNNASGVFDVPASTGVALKNLIITNGSFSLGGGVQNGGTLTITQCSIVSNKSVEGGGISNLGVLTLQASTISGNSATVGGGIFNRGTMSLSYDAIVNNSATQNGGGIVDYTAAAMSNITVTGNSAVTGGGLYEISASNPTVNNSIIAGNTASTSADVDYTNGSTTISGSGNVVGTTTSLSALGNYGGPTQTMVPLPGSAAICAGVALNIPTGVTTDQRGQPNTNATYLGYNAGTPCVDAGAMQTNYSLEFVGQPSTVVQNAAMSPAPAVKLLESGAAFADGSDAVSIPLSLSTGAGTLAGGSSSTSASTGIAAYSSLSVSLPGMYDKVTASLALNASASPAPTISMTSNTFDVNSAVTQLAFATAPAATVTAGGNAGSSIVVHEEDAGGALVTTAGDAITLSVTGPKSYTESYTTTAANGVATFNLSSVHLSAAGTYNYTASIAGNGSVSAALFGEAVSAESAATVSVVSGSGQSAEIGSAFASSLTVKVVDQYSNPVSGATVVFAAPPSGAGATFSTPAVTAADGTTSATATANGIASVTAYTVTASVAGATTPATFTLTNTQVSTTLTVSPGASSIVYGQPETITALISPASIAGSSPTGSATFYDGSTALTPASSVTGAAASYTVSVPTVGGHTYKAQYAGDGNFKQSVLTQAANSVTVGKAASTLAGPSSTVNLTYGTGGTISISVAGRFTGSGILTPGGSVTYTIGAGAPQTAAITSGAATLAVPAAQAAGSYTVAVSYDGDTNYNVATNISVSLKIEQATATLVATPYNVTYDGLAHTATGTATGVGGVNLAADLNLTATTHTVAGTYNGDTWTFHDPAGNYADASGTVNDQIGKATATLVATPYNVTYDGLAHTATGTATGVGGANLAVDLNLTATTHTAAGTYNGDTWRFHDPAGNYADASGTVNDQIGKATLHITANSASRVYGTANPVFTGTVTDQQNGDSFTETFSTAASISSPADTYAIIPSVSGATLADYAQSVTDGTLTITQAASTTALHTSSTSITPGQEVTLTAAVTSQTTGTPTGSVNFYEGAAVLGTATLNAGMATYSTASLAPGLTHTVVATYSGDQNFNGSSSEGGSISVAVAPLDFTMTLSGPTTLTVVPGQSISYQVRVSPDYGSYAGTVNFAMSGLPAGATATFSPSSIAANGGPQTVTVTIQVAPESATLHAAPPDAGRKYQPFALAFLLLAGMAGVRKRGRAVRRMLCVVLLLAGGAVTLLSGCGAHAGFFTQAPQNYSVTVTATSANLQHSTTLTLNVQ